jgi:glycosyltransferase involved in cell wall biosynthesis
MKLPKPPSLQDFEATIPRITPVAEGVYRPFWSVMIPTYNCAEYVGRTLESVLSQDPGPNEMQIEVVDGCSSKDDPEEIVRKLGKERVGFSRLPCNRGPGFTFNGCIERSRGYWVHILHGDDLVLPGFYERYARLIKAHSNLSMVCGRYLRVDEKERWLSLKGPMPSEDSELIEDYVRKYTFRNDIPFASAVVARRTYEQVGGFNPVLEHSLDDDMWFRAGRIGNVGCVAQAYSCARVHEESLTSRLLVSARNVEERYLLSFVNLARLKSDSGSMDRSWIRELAGYAEGMGWHFEEIDQLVGAMNQARWAWALGPNYRRLKLLVKVWLRQKVHWLRSLANRKVVEASEVGQV